MFSLTGIVQYLHPIKDIKEEDIELGVDISYANINGWTALMFASLVGNTEVVKPLLYKGADVNHKDKYGYTVLMLASANGRTEVVEPLLAARPDVNYKSRYNETLLILAHNKEIRQMLVSAMDKK